MRKGKNVKDALLYTLLLVFSILFIVLGNRFTSKNAYMFLGQSGQGRNTERYIVRIDTVLDRKVVVTRLGESVSFTETTTLFSSTVLFGERRGETIIASQTLNDMISSTEMPAKEGLWIFVYPLPDSNVYFAGNYFRLHYLIGVALVFFVLLLLFARFQGLSTIIALGLSVTSVFLVFIPAILSGLNIYLWAIIICLFTITINPYFIGGFNKKSTVSALGCVGGVTIAGGITLLLNWVLMITGSINDETMYVSFILEDKPIDLRAIVFAAILIGALGATVDVSMSISTSINEMNESTSESSFSSLVQYGMNIGRDILGAQTSTLVLAYIGGALSVTLLLFAYQPSVIEMLNVELVVIELLQMLIGGFVILFTIPATALVAALIFDKKTGQVSGKKRTQRRDDERNRGRRTRHRRY